MQCWRSPEYPAMKMMTLCSRPAAAAGSLATCSPSIRAIAWHCSRIIRSTQIDSMVVFISSAALATGEGFAAIASEERLGSDRRRRDNVNKEEQ